MENSTDPRVGTSHADQAPWSVPAEQAGTGTAGATADVPADDTSGVRVGTVVWGLVIAAVGIGLLALAAGLVFDVQLAVIVLVALAGVGLVIGSLVSASRRRGRTGD